MALIPDELLEKLLVEGLVCPGGPIVAATAKVTQESEDHRIVREVMEAPEMMTVDLTLVYAEPIRYLSIPGASWTGG